MRIIGFGLILMLHMRGDLPIFFAIGAAVYRHRPWGLRDALACFPWENVPLFELYQQMQQRALLSANNSLKHLILLGWPYYRGPWGLRASVGRARWKDRIARWRESYGGIAIGCFVYLAEMHDFQKPGGTKAER